MHTYSSVRLAVPKLRQVISIGDGQNCRSFKKGRKTATPEKKARRGAKKDRTFTLKQKGSQREKGRRRSVVRTLNSSFIEKGAKST